MTISNENQSFNQMVSAANEKRFNDFLNNPDYTLVLHSVLPTHYLNLHKLKDLNPNKYIFIPNLNDNSNLNDNKNDLANQPHETSEFGYINLNCELFFIKKSFLHNELGEKINISNAITNFFNHFKDNDLFIFISIPLFIPIRNNKLNIFRPDDKNIPQFIGDCKPINFIEHFQQMLFEYSYLFINKMKFFITQFDSKRNDFIEPILLQN